MISIHQSQFLPWVPYFYKIAKADVFVLMDDVQYQKNGVQNRNKIKTSNGELWVTVPVRCSLGDAINQIEIADQGALSKMLKTLEMNYKKARFYREIFDQLEPLLSRRYASLHELNSALMHKVLELTGVKTRIVTTSSMNLSQKKDDLVIEIIKQMGETDYLSGKGAFAYMDLNKFRDNGISVHTYDFTYAEYPQLWTKNQGFIPDLSILDLLFNAVDTACSYINGNGSVKRMQ